MSKELSNIIKNKMTLEQRKFLVLGLKRFKPNNSIEEIEKQINGITLSKLFSGHVSFVIDWRYRSLFTKEELDMKIESTFK